MNLPDRVYDILRLRLRSLFGKGRVESELERELRFHLEQQEQENIAKGMSPEEARLAAMRRLGGFAQVQEECRDMRRTNQIETLWTDLKYSGRTLRRTPGFVIVMIATMGLAIGANTAIFSVVEGVLLRPLPFQAPDRLIRIFYKSENHAKFPLNPFDFRDFKDRNQTLESAAAILHSDVQLSGAGDSARLSAFQVTADYFRVLGFTPALGRDFTAEDNLPKQGHLAILSDRLWRTRFQADPSVLGRSIMLESVPYTVIGVMPPNTQHPGNTYHALADGDTVDLWYPFTFEGNPNNRGSHYLDVIARLKRGVTPDQATADLSSILTQLAEEHQGDRRYQVFALPLYTELVGHTRPLLLILLGAVGVLLLIACVNAANLLLARASGRMRELAVRGALGAPRGRLFRQLLTESLVIALLGGTLGAVIAAAGVQVLVSLIPASFPRTAGIHLNFTVLLFTLAVTIATGLIFGLIPAFSASRVDLQQNLRDGARGATAGRHLRLRNFLVAGETGLACLLLIAGGLMFRSFANLLKTDPGFHPTQVLTASIALPEQNYKDDAAVNRFSHRLVDGLRDYPGVDVAGTGSDLPWTGWDENIGGFNVEGRGSEDNEHTTARFHVASPDYFKALGINLLAGRYFDDRDSSSALPSIIVNESMARRYWPVEDAVGKRISMTDKPKEAKDWFTVVGVVDDIKDEPDSPSARPAFWFAEAQSAASAMSVVVRSSRSVADITTRLRSLLGEIDGSLALADIRQMNQVVDGSFAPRRFSLFLVGLFAVMALILATIGIYGVISYSVSQRRNEFGIRMALGANGFDLIRMVITQGLKFAVGGATVGLISAAVLTRLLDSLLYGVGGQDPLTFAAVAAAILFTATIACYIPGRVAARTDPVRSLNSD